MRTYLERDLRSLFTISSLVDFWRLMRLTCLYIGQIVNQSELGRGVSLKQATTHRYLNILEISYMLTRLPAYTTKRNKRLVKSSKFYWGDVGLALYLSQAKPNGFHLENIILNNLLSWRDASLEQADIFYWRTVNGQEVDFVIETTDSLLPLEVKATTRPSFKDTLNLQLFMREYKQAERGLLLHAGKDLEWITSNILAVPWWYM